MPQAEILFGTIIDSNMNGRAEITVIATGVHTERVAYTKTAAAASTEAAADTEETKEDDPTKIVTTPATTTTTPLPPEALSLVEIFGDELAVPAFMRSRKRVRLEELYVA